MTNEENDAIYKQIVETLFSDVQEKDQFYEVKPLLAHYTTLQTLESILKNDEIWFSNPLFMNDLEEVRFGILEGVKIFQNSKEITEAFGDSEKHQRYLSVLNHYLTQFEEGHLLDTYVFCLSEHNPDEMDGRLSMWRGYGGDGNGAAIVFDTSQIQRNDDTPLKLAKVEYGSTEQRREYLEALAKLFASEIRKVDLKMEQIYLASYAAFERLKMFALYTKHSGFAEEQEWRAVYFSELDGKGVLEDMKHYHNGPRGVEPKLKFKVKPIENFTTDDLRLSTIIDSIILGPSTSSPLAVRSVERMMDKLHKSDLKDRVYPSSIPLRPKG